MNERFRDSKIVREGIKIAGLTALFIVMMLWLSGWTVGCAVLGIVVFYMWKSRKIAAAVGTTLFAVPFFIGERRSLVKSLKH